MSFVLYEGIIYGILLFVGGAIGYRKAGSKPSLIMGTASGILAIGFSAYAIKVNELMGLFLLAAEALVLSSFFYMRYTKTKKFMPGGLMCAISMVSFALYFVAICAA